MARAGPSHCDKHILAAFSDEEIAAEHERRRNAGTCKWCKKPFVKHQHGKCPN